MRSVLLCLLVCVPSLWAGEGPKSRTPRGAYEALLNEYEAAVIARDKNASNVTPADPLWVKQYEAMPMWSFAPRFLQFAEANSKDPAAVDALLKIVEFLGTGRAADKFLYPSAKRAVNILISDHLQDERVVQACLKLADFGGGVLEPYFRALLARSRDREVLGRACLALVQCNDRRVSIAARPYFDHPEDNPKYLASSAFLNNRLDPEFIGDIRTTDPLSTSAETEAFLTRIIDEFGDIPFLPRWATAPPPDKAKIMAQIRTLADYARPKLEARRSRAVGMPAPEIEGQDIDGKPLRLSDYRGKVVVLVFWGTWCGPCMGFLPTEKALVERLKGRPFALLGINSDGDREGLKAAVAEKGITWPSWWDGGRTGGPIATRWDVHRWPTIIVLDKSGVIRFKNLPHNAAKRLDDAVDGLLEEKRP
jgi:thiol-disulfide isomerase/thioredoxin